MSDSEVEFESADEGSKGDGGWEVDDFELPDVESSMESKPTEITSYVSKMEITKQNSQCNNEDVKPSEENVSSDTVTTLQSRLGNLAVNNDNTICDSQIPKESKVIQSEIKPTNTVSSVSINILFSYLYFFKKLEKSNF